MRGVDKEFGSLEETLAYSALERRSLIQFSTTTTIISAIIHAGNTIASAMTGGGSVSPDKLQESLTELRDLLLPQSVDNLQRRAEEVRKTLEAEYSRGPIQVESMERKNTKGRVRLRRK